ncbi:MAG: four helix bundle protein [Bacteroidales bacterium]|nr:four helix bundle protein [Bacteroidales bacterium]
MIWQKGMEIVTETYKLSICLPKNEKYGLVSQITRAAVSIPTNIAEGSSRSSTNDYKRFLEYALGSTYELETLLLAIISANIITNSNASEELMNLIIEEQKMLTSFLHTLPP